MVNGPEVSVVVSAYNHEKYVGALLKSILGQTYKDFELVIIDDGSTDSTPNIIEEFANRYSGKMRFSRQENKGFVKTINSAFKMCRGRYIAPVGSDDIWLPNKLEEQIKKFNEDPSLSLVYADINIVNEDGEVLCRFNRFNKPYWGKITDRLFISNFISAITPVYKRELFEQYGYWDERYNIASDYEFILRVSPHIKVGYVNKVLGLYRTHEHSSSTVNIEKTVIEGLDVRKQFLALRPGLIKRGTILRAYSNVYFRMAEANVSGGNRKKAIKYYIKACCCNPLFLQGHIGLVLTLMGINYYKLKQVIKKKLMR
ncbi:MAG: glycosyltransferase [Planctomycetota bacterium]